MKRLICCCLCLVTCHVWASQKMHSPSYQKEISSPEGAKIRVLLAQNTKAALVEVKGPYRICCDADKKALSAGSQGKRYVLYGVQDGIRFGEEFPEVKEISIIPTAAHSRIFVNGFQYEGRLHVYVDQHKKLALVNELPVEKFLKSSLSIVSHPLKSKASQEAYAILTRPKAIQQGA